MIEGTPSTAVAAQLKRVNPSLEELRQMASQIEALKAQPGWEVLMGLLEGMRENALTRMIRGPVRESAAEYARQLGLLDGLGVAPDAVETVLHLAKQAEKEAEAIAKAVERE